MNSYFFNGHFHPCRFGPGSVDVSKSPFTNVVENLVILQQFTTIILFKKVICVKKILEWKKKRNAYDSMQFLNYCSSCSCSNINLTSQIINNEFNKIIYINTLNIVFEILYCSKKSSLTSIRNRICKQCLCKYIYLVQDI